MNETGRKIFGILAFAGVALLALAGKSFYDTRQFMARAHRTQGVVVELQTVSSDNRNGSVTYKPIVEYVLPSGEKTLYAPSWSSNPAPYRVNDQVEMLYDPDSPQQQVSINSFAGMWLSTLLFGAIGAVIFLTSGIVLLFSSNQRKKREKLLETGTPVQSVFNRVEQNLSTRVNRRSPYVVVTHWADPVQKGVIWEFKSPNLWYNPTSFIAEHQIRQITVYVDPNNYKRYAMDLSQFPTVKK